MNDLSIKSIDDKNTIQFGDLFVHCVEKEFFPGLTLTADEWINKKDLNTFYYGDDTWVMDEINKWDEVIKAITAVTKHPCWGNNLKEKPYVAYDIINDYYYFIFEIIEAGITFVVSKRYMKEIFQND